jgi:hypothetical protein
MKEFNPTQRLLDLNAVLAYDTSQKEKGKAGHFSQLERIRINQERGQLFAGKENFRHAQPLEQKIEFVIKKISPPTPEGGVRSN